MVNRRRSFIEIREAHEQDVRDAAKTTKTIQQKLNVDDVNLGLKHHPERAADIVKYLQNAGVDFEGLREKEEDLFKTPDGIKAVSTCGSGASTATPSECGSNFLAGEMEDLIDWNHEYLSECYNNMEVAVAKVMKGRLKLVEPSRFDDTAIMRLAPPGKRKSQST